MAIKSLNGDDGDSDGVIVDKLVLNPFLSSFFINGAGFLVRSFVIKNVL